MVSIWYIYIEVPYIIPYMVYTYIYGIYIWYNMEYYHTTDKAEKVTRVEA